uniref:Flagellar associated protein n=1 Tax=Hemiselmis tepida TaxID=464990 RepID=A0A7S0WJ42_9CRYP|mmetsp:Transcript_9231/g.24213  ORF Transcript_9231/g.24213 Transcript_9231/m.24213 type:complete len:196 (+) Transcript_9231:76-663(+)
MSGFRAVQPETRADRAAKQDKTTLEKGRLAQRREKFTRYVDLGNPTEMSNGAVGFLADADRFHSDTAGEEKLHRDKNIQRREDMYELKRNQFLDREENRWSSMEGERSMEQQKLEIMQNTSKGTRNHSSVAYDCVTLEYHATPAGMQQRFEDDMSRYRAGVRTEKLHRFSSGDGYNPITGEELRALRLPAKPEAE